ncbi:MAG: hypothetical protein ACRYG7_06275 [Janthinobacterium lividum]
MISRLLAFALVLPPVAGPAPAFYTTYTYVAYTVYDHTTDDPPTQVRGVGGTLALRANGTYDKRLTILVGNSGPRYFTQHGRFSTKDDSIFFKFSDLKGPDVQRGTFRYVPGSKKLIIRIVGYPPGNYGDYELVALPLAPQVR